MNKKVLMTMALCALTMSMTCFGSDGKESDDRVESNGFAAAKGGTLQVRAPLAGPAIGHELPAGHADFKSEPARKRTSFTVEVQNVNLADGTVLSVMVVHAGSTTTVGSLTLTAQFGQLELRSQDGDVVPQIHKGDMVHVSQGSTTILTGVF